jgi:hypothetical protein
MVTVSKAVVISGGPAENGEMPTIQGGNWPFFVGAPGARVTFDAELTTGRAPDMQPAGCTSRPNRLLCNLEVA